ncbi:non-ribosomal peptide synthetase [Photobacterium sp. OFAV2-7]|uniref:non-ribosomal peptide synthetase n=1 Tax=Photobacterium sp. OFAV2-7 TaxID=2917748 RepID=UPI001EF62D92|nr:non-ribosomal peptide synthetase [Photobacterium sp. OFAV2-7]MCG7584772.1 amino acid adenylation domain-containing protein [Photobacterium sp. OFAV2-7]
MTDIITLLMTLERKGVRLTLNSQSQLVSQANKQAMTPDVVAQIKANKDDIVRCLKAQQAFDQPIPVTRQTSGPLSYSQSGLWFIEQYEENSHLYNMPVHFRVTGPLDYAALEYAFDVLAQKHASLRTRFAINEYGKGEQHIDPHTPFKVEHKDLSHLPDNEREDVLLQWIIDDVNRPFDLNQGQLTRVDVVKLEEELHILMLTQHHIVSDGWSVKNMFADFKQAFLSYQNQQLMPVVPTERTYIDYANWFNSPAFQDYHAEFKPFWVERLVGIPEVHSLPLDKPRPAAHDNDGELVFSAIDNELWAKFKRLCQQYSTSNFIGLHAVFSLLMARLSDEQDIVIGTPLAYRERHDIEDVVGFFVNTIVLRTQLGEQQRFVDYLQYCREQDLSAFDHQLYRFESLSEAIGTDRTTAINPIFQIMLIYQAKVDFNDLIPGCGAVEEPSPILPAKTDISLKVTELVDGVRLDWLFSKGIFEKATIERYAEHFLHLLTAVVEQPECNVQQLPMIAEDEETAVASQLAQLPAAYQDNLLTHQLFENAVVAHPDKLAVVAGEQSLTYAELDTRANQLAHWLIERGVRHESLVGIVAERGIAFAVSALAAWKAGGAYVPLDPAYPLKRLQHVIDDAELSLILAPSSEFSVQIQQGEGDLNLTGAELVNLADSTLSERLAQFSDTSPLMQEPLMQNATPQQLAYVIYTSGSTGMPKGVMVEHGSFVNLVHDHSQRLAFAADSVMFNCMSLAFDAGNMTAMLPLASGITLAFGEPNEQAINQAEQYHATHMICSTALFAALPPQAVTSLKIVAFGGEACPPQLVERWADKVDLFNMYGPTEFTVTALAQQLKADQPVTIGTSVANTQALILDAQGKLCPDGVPGELCLAGLGLARGYLNQPELTEKVFTEWKCQGQSARLYHTGDKARVNRDGLVEYMGRIDEQVKLRGYRIELGEIEAQLAAVEPAIHQVKVRVAEQGSRKVLVAYATLRGCSEENGSSAENITSEGVASAATASMILHRALAVLPEYMVPAHLFFVDDMPLTANGKLDPQRLPSLDVSETTSASPHSELEASVLAIWQSTLNNDCGVEDDFFRLGGDSILSIQLTTRLRDAGYACTVKDVFEAKTVRRLCRTLADNSETVPAIEAEQGVLSGSFPLLPIQSWFAKQDFAKPQHWNQAAILKIPALSEAQLVSAMDQLFEHHDALRLALPQWDEDSLFDGVVSQQYNDTAILPQLVELDAASLGDDGLFRAFTELQSDFDLASGQTMAWVLVRNHPQAESALFLAFNHWVIDAVSWRILTDDFSKLCRGEALGRKTTSYRQWGEVLADYTRHNPAQFDYWREQAKHGDSALLQKDRHPDGQASAAMLQLPEALTQRLVSGVHHAFNTEVNDILLAALVKSLSDLGWGDAHTIMLEGHGREDISPQHDVSRTVGWFTSTYPLLLAVPTDASLQDESSVLTALIQQTKERRRAIPDKGIGFAAFGQHHPEGEQLALSPIVFNYLGLQTQAKGDWRPIGIEPGQVLSSLNKPSEIISLHGGIIDGALTLRQVGCLTQARSEQLMATFAANIETFIAFCEQSYAERGCQPTPADYPLVNLSQEVVDQLHQTFDVEAIVPASSLQASMFAHQKRCPQDDAYHLQTPIHYPHALNVDAYQQAWELAADRFPALRVALQNQGELVQVIRRKIEVAIKVIDLTDSNANEHTDPLAVLARYQAADLERPFVLGEATEPLFRLLCIKASETDHHVLFSCHHAIIDGWSGPRLFGAVHEAYLALQGGAGEDLAMQNTVQNSQQESQQELLTAGPKDNAYLEHAAYAVNNQEAVSAYWQKKDITKQARNDLSVLFEADFAQATMQQKPAVVRLRLTDNEQQRLVNFAQAAGVTNSVVVQYAWHRLVAKVTGDAVTVVGNVASGRDAPVDEIAASVGLYINSLPLVMRWNTGMTLGEHIAELQRELMGLNEHATQSLIELHNGQPRCFDSLFVFENYPRPAMRADQHPVDVPLAPVFGQAYEKVEFPLNVVVTEVAGRTALRFEFDEAEISEDKADDVLAQWLAELLEIIRLPIDNDSQILLRTGNSISRAHDSEELKPEVDTTLSVSAEWEELVMTVRSAWMSVLANDAVQPADIWHATLSDLAINSLDVIRLAASLSHMLSDVVTPAVIYQSSSPAGFAQQFWAERQTASTRREASASNAVSADTVAGDTASADVGEASHAE